MKRILAIMLVFVAGVIAAKATTDEPYGPTIVTKATGSGVSFHGSGCFSDDLIIHWTDPSGVTTNSFAGMSHGSSYVISVEKE